MVWKEKLTNIFLYIAAFVHSESRNYFFFRSNTTDVLRFQEVQNYPDCLVSGFVATPTETKVVRFLPRDTMLARVLAMALCLSVSLFVCHKSEEFY